MIASATMLGNSFAKLVMASVAMTNTNYATPPQYHHNTYCELIASNSQSFEDYSHINSNYSITIDMSNDDILVQRSVYYFINCINEEPVELGTIVSYTDYFEDMRNNKNYKQIFNKLTKYSDRIRQSIINLLSIIPYDNIQSYEESFVIDELCSKSVIIEECALNTISMWDDKRLFQSISDVQLKNQFLQKRLERLISFYT